MFIKGRNMVMSCTKCIRLVYKHHPFLRDIYIVLTENARQNGYLDALYTSLRVLVQ
jgi:hypothetical protein